MIGRRLQNYKVLSLLGQGGMGAVYKAFDVKPGDKMYRAPAMRTKIW